MLFLQHGDGLGHLADVLAHHADIRPGHPQHQVAGVLMTTTWGVSLNMDSS